MKKKLLLILCAGMLLGGCNGELVNGQVYESPTKQETGREQVKEQEKGQEKDPVKEQDKEQDKEQGGASVQVKPLGAASEKEIVSVTLTDGFQKAAYFADQVYDEKMQNVIVSPLSLEVALGLAYEGASGTTAEELENYFGTENYADWVDEYLSFAESTRVSGPSNGDYSFAYELANSIWVKKDGKLTEDYVSVVKNKYRATAENVDFLNDAENVALKINSWCDEKTHGMIRQMVSADMFTEGLQAILMNSLYFESPWIEEWFLSDHEFTNLKGEKETREMLRSCVTTYFENDKATAFAKDYFNGFEFIGILPKTTGEFGLSDLDLRGLLASRSTDYAVIAVAPKLDFETTADNVVDILKAQGIRQAFDRYEGMFDRMVVDKELFISDILQKCKIEMDEKGTRAAAVTMILAEECADEVEPEVREIKEVFLDRPFAFLIYDRFYDKIVFAGKVVE